MAVLDACAVLFSAWSTVAVGSDGKIVVYNNAGSIQLVAELEGYLS